MSISEKQLAANRLNAKKAHAATKVEKLKFICKECGKEFEVYPSQVKKGFGDVCSWECRVKYRRGENAIATGPRMDMIGEKNPNWKGGKSLIPRKQRNITKEHLAWKRKVFARDKYTCQYCGSKKHLNAHHILPFAEHPDVAYDIDNGTTLCEDCHKIEHSIGYAYKRIFKAIVNNESLDDAIKHISKSRMCIAHGYIRAEAEK